MRHRANCRRSEPDWTSWRRKSTSARCDASTTRATASTASGPLLQGRYQIVELLGKGGFSEVWYAIDLWSLCEVAIKVHQLASTWSDERKSSYIKHAIRENDIQKVGVCGGGKA